MNIKNPAAKRRDIQNPYASWVDEETGQKVYLLKSYQTDNNALWARWHMKVGDDMGDAYVTDMRLSLFMSKGLFIDNSIWSTQEKFFGWVNGLHEEPTVPRPPSRRRTK